MSRRFLQEGLFEEGGFAAGMALDDWQEEEEWSWPAGVTLLVRVEERWQDDL